MDVTKHFTVTGYCTSEWWWCDDVIRLRWRCRRTETVFDPTDHRFSPVTSTLLVWSWRPPVQITCSSTWAATQRYQHTHSHTVQHAQDSDLCDSDLCDLWSLWFSDSDFCDLCDLLTWWLGGSDLCDSLTLWLVVYGTLCLWSLWLISGTLISVTCDLWDSGTLISGTLISVFSMSRWLADSVTLISVTWWSLTWMKPLLTSVVHSGGLPGSRDAWWEGVSRVGCGFR